jgi:hypothetical protein
MVGLVLGLGLGLAEPSAEWRSGDLIFLESRSSQAVAIRAATASRWTHVGLVAVDEEGRVTVIEAVEPVREVPVEAFLARGGAWAGARLVELPLAEGWPARVLASARAELGRPYDPLFDWGDERLYCSELVWKAFERGLGLELSPLQQLGHLDLEAPEVKRLIAARQGGRALVLEQPIVTPAGLARSPLMVQVAGTADLATGAPR